MSKDKDKDKKDEYNQVKNIPTYLATSSSVFIYQFFIILTITLRKPIFPLFLICLTISFIINETLKRNILQNRPSNCGAIIDGECAGCGLYPDKTMVSANSMGMPSGHSQITAFTATFWSLYFMDINKSFPIPILWSLSFLVWYQRYHSRCHSLSQISTGVFIGIILGFISYKIVKNGQK